MELKINFLKTVGLLRRKETCHSKAGCFSFCMYNFPIMPTVSGNAKLSSKMSCYTLSTLSHNTMNHKSFHLLARSRLDFGNGLKNKILHFIRLNFFMLKQKFTVQDQLFSETFVGMLQRKKWFAHAKPKYLLRGVHKASQFNQMKGPH